jgi:hypothetical protein
MPGWQITLIAAAAAALAAVLALLASHQTDQESRSTGHRAAPSVTVMCFTTKPKGDKA